MAIYDQLTPEEYMDVAAYLVSPMAARSCSLPIISCTQTVQ